MKNIYEPLRFLQSKFAKQAFHIRSKFCYKLPCYCLVSRCLLKTMKTEPSLPSAVSGLVFKFRVLFLYRGLYDESTAKYY
jgi:hypothetical protein